MHRIGLVLMGWLPLRHSIDLACLRRCASQAARDGLSSSLEIWSERLAGAVCPLQHPCHLWRLGSLLLQLSGSGVRCGSNSYEVALNPLSPFRRTHRCALGLRFSLLHSSRLSSYNRFCWRQGGSIGFRSGFEQGIGWCWQSSRASRLLPPSTSGTVARLPRCHFLEPARAVAPR